MEKIIFHIDVNNAFLSWTAIDLLNKGYNYDIRDIYAVIGGDEELRKGIVLSKSVKAKNIGILTAETLYSARKKCPNLKVYKPDHNLYQKMSNKLFNLLLNYTDDIQVSSIDECYLDYGKIKNIYKDEVKFAYFLKDKIKNDLGFTVNIGIANNKLCAKMASDFSKPNKIHTLYDYEIKEKMYPLDVKSLFGIGKMTALKLKNLKINTIGDLANSDPYFLKKYFKNQALDMIKLAQGKDNSEVDNSKIPPKGISNEITLLKDTDNKEELKKYLHELSKKLAERIKKENKYATTIAVILKDNKFRRFSHQKKLKNPTNISIEISSVACTILDEINILNKIRLIGIRLDNLVKDTNYQISMFEEPIDRKKEEKLEQTITILKNKYGPNIFK